jgi:hypothetical protein
MTAALKAAPRVGLTVGPRAWYLAAQRVDWMVPRLACLLDHSWVDPRADPKVVRRAARKARLMVHKWAVLTARKSAHLWVVQKVPC